MGEPGAGHPGGALAYDQPVLAVADAVVTAAADRYPDQVPNAPQPVGIDDADRNFVILQLADGRYAF